MRTTAISWAFLALIGCGSAKPPEAEAPTNAGVGSQEDDPQHQVSAQESGEGLTVATDPEGRGQDGDNGEWGILGDPSYASVVEKVVGMAGDQALTQAVNRRGLSLLNVMWEDTGRQEGSALGPNITDLTLQVRYRVPGDEQERAGLLPVIRFPNFEDRTADIRADKFFVRVGNQRDKKNLKTVALKDVLKNIRGYLATPWSLKGSGNLLAARDTHFLVSAQAVFLPIPKKGQAEFNPVVFNYQSAPGSPAVLTLLVTRQGTSITAIENSPQDSTTSGYGQELYFNNEGQRAAFTAERKQDVERRISAQGGPKTADDKSALARGADVLFLVQVPLRHRNRGYLGGIGSTGGSVYAPSESMAPSAAPKAMASEEGAMQKSDVEQAVLGHGKNRGAFLEGNDLALERDPAFPIRITVQFYKATSNGVVSERDLDGIAASIGGVYEHADFVGSLVIPEGDRSRPTEWQKMPREWFPW
ncbi:MAG: hypothetical protein SFV15_23830 [Polyangiaceae bacterium]|nr:hypothetical protein [Polyangiaceae bacterium]